MRYSIILVVFSLFSFVMGWALCGFHIFPEVTIETKILGTENLTVYRVTPFQWRTDNITGYYGYEGYIPDTYTLKYLPTVGWVVTTNNTIQRLQGWLDTHPNMPSITE